jgi:hypothetical protein
MKHFYDNFLKALEERYPRKLDLVNALMDILNLEKESIYRRLRKDVYFTAEETMRIAGTWNISLDNIISVNPDKTRPFHFNMIEYVGSREADYRLLESYNRELELIGRDPDAKMIEVLNSMPHSLYCLSEDLTRFFTMKWLYKYGMSEEIAPFSEIPITERMRELDMEYVKRIHNISEVHAIHDDYFIKHLVDEILYFHSIGMVTKDEVTLLKKELLMIIEYMEEVTVNGYFPDTKNKLFFYLSHTWLSTEYILFESKYSTRSFVRILERSSIASNDKKVFDRFMNMVQATKRSSVLMSGSNTLQRVEFFAKQKNMIDTRM